MNVEHYTSFSHCPMCGQAAINGNFLCGCVPEPSVTTSKLGGSIPKIPDAPDVSCEACDRGEKTITPPFSSILGPGLPVHHPSGMLCSKFLPKLPDAAGKRNS